MTQQDDAQVLCHTGHGFVHDEDLATNGTDDVMGDQQLIDETVREMLQTFEDNMQEQWLDEIMHELDS